MAAKLKSYLQSVIKSIEETQLRRAQQYLNNHRG
jgi:hypothetical protein